MNKGLKLPCVFSDNMILQRNKPIAVWGECDNDVEVIFDNESYKCKCEKGRFRVNLNPHKEAKNLTLTIKSGEEKIVFLNVSVGEVWLAGGQSNMELRLNEVTDGMYDLQFCEFHDNIKYFISPTDIENVFKAPTAGWQNVVESDGEISAVAFYFAKRLYSKLKVPIGIIDCNLDGSSVFHWIPRESLLEDEELKRSTLQYDKILNNDFKDFDFECSMSASNTIPYGTCFEKKIKPIAPYAINGVIWYQSESDGAGETRAKAYKKAFLLMIKEWQKSFENDDLSFIQVLLASYSGEWVGYGTGRAWAYMREAQIELADENENIYYVCAVDRGDSMNIHPSGKIMVGERLAGCALCEVYGYEIKWKSMTVKEIKQENNKIIITLNNTYGKVFSDTSSTIDFEVQRHTRECVSVKSKITGPDTIEIETDLPTMTVYHAFATGARVRLYNKMGLPLIPFRYTFHF